MKMWESFFGAIFAGAVTFSMIHVFELAGFGSLCAWFSSVFLGVSSSLGVDSVLEGVR